MPNILIHQPSLIAWYWKNNLTTVVTFCCQIFTDFSKKSIYLANIYGFTKLSSGVFSATLLNQIGNKV